MSLKPFCVFDIETTDLNDFGHMLACSFGELHFGASGWKTKLSTMTILEYPPDKEHEHDKKLVDAVVNKLSEYNCIIGWYSKGFDVKFIRRRLLDHRLRDWKPKQHLDLYYVYKHNFKTGFMSCRLQAAGEFLDISEPKMIIDRKTWKKAWYNDPDAMQRIKKRGESDVKMTCDIFQILLPYAGNASFRPT